METYPAVNGEPAKVASSVLQGSRSSRRAHSVPEVLYPSPMAHTSQDVLRPPGQFDHILKYAERHGISLQEPTATRGNRVYYAAQTSIVHMRKLTRTQHLSIEIPKVEGADLMIALWSNYTWLTAELEDKDRKEVVSILQEELGIAARPL
ncbi:hypothetical protein EVG20_g6982 [Dentipellis fragilis]|uniref:Uncharacterized protein n=1 Tax=Dentipellis fragilis TaxID=205917 RepID=A0A4Y9YI31_9AGAM|nr:hypothetical protein EVG20_g6982 [Dentipellis fragilis]